MSTDLATVVSWLRPQDKQITLNHYTQVLYMDNNIIETNNLMSSFLDNLDPLVLFVDLICGLLRKLARA